MRTSSISRRLMDRFYAKHRDRLMQETNQANIGGRIATIAAMMIPLAFRITSAFQVVDMKPAERRIVDVKIKRWDPNPVGEDVVTSYANLDPGEGDGSGTAGVIATSNLSYLNFPIYVTRQALRSRITPEAIATAAGSTPMMPSHGYRRRIGVGRDEPTRQITVVSLHCRGHESGQKSGNDCRDIYTGG